MSFEAKKKATIIRMDYGDKSKKGSVDSDIRELVDNINKSDKFYTTSSCSGRIVLMNKCGKRKDMNDWLLASHSTITSDEFDRAMQKEGKEEVWFMQEAPILHVCARDMDAAGEFMEMCKDAGFKRSYIISFSGRIIIELLGSEKMETIIYSDDTMYVNSEYRDLLIKHANAKMISSKDKLAKLTELSKNI